MLMKVQVEEKPESISTLKIELPADEVSKEWDTIANSFARFAKIPGYRPGKAPRAVIDKRFRKEIQDEVTKKLVSKSYREAIEQKKLRVASLTNLEDVQFGEDKSMRFQATVVTAPEFKLPDYKNIPVEVPDTKVTEAEIGATLERLRDQTADFVDVQGRGAQMEDFDQRSRPAGEQEFTWRQKILAAFGGGQFSAEILRADRWTKAG